MEDEDENAGALPNYPTRRDLENKAETRRQNDHFRKRILATPNAAYR